MRQKQSIFSLFLLSPSSRRAWIEITVIRISLTRKLVALLVEGVDRNLCVCIELPVRLSSPSSRRAWIEISWY